MVDRCSLAEKGRLSLKNPHEKYPERWMATNRRRLDEFKRYCQNPEDPSYRYYGGRGIQFEFATVRAAMVWIAEHLGPPPIGKTLYRIDPNGNFGPGNLQWASRHMMTARKAGES